MKSEINGILFVDPSFEIEFEQVNGDFKQRKPMFNFLCEKCIFTTFYQKGVDYDNPFLETKVEFCIQEGPALWVHPRCVLTHTCLAATLGR